MSGAGSTFWRLLEGNERREGPAWSTRTQRRYQCLMTCIKELKMPKIVDAHFYLSISEIAWTKFAACRPLSLDTKEDSRKKRKRKMMQLHNIRTVPDLFTRLINTLFDSLSSTITLWKFHNLSQYILSFFAIPGE